jgi:two-component system, OmpR family, sensor histidine kinase BaeS
MRSVLALCITIAVVALVVSEAAMRPSPQERVTLYGTFVAAAVVAGLVGWWLTRAHRRLPSLRWTILAVAVVAVGVASGVVLLAAGTMVLTPADARVVLAALTLGTGLGLLVAIGVTGPLTADLRQLARTARRVADGDLSARTDIERSDEVGELARSVDRMVDQLAELEGQRQRDEAARHRLLTAVGHDLRTPLATLQAAVESLQDGVAADPDRYLRAMATDVELLRGMVDDLLELTGLEAGEVRIERILLDLAEVADGAVEALAPVAARQHVKIALQANDTVPVLGDARALDRVLRNLLDNALRHAPPDSTVTVEVATDGDIGEVRVHDDGPGFPEEFIERAFERLSRADEARERHGGGSGLGLAIARELVEAHSGRIWIEPGPGATVVFHVPSVSVPRGTQHPPD